MNAVGGSPPTGGATVPAGGRAARQRGGWGALPHVLGEQQRLCGEGGGDDDLYGAQRQRNAALAGED